MVANESRFVELPVIRRIIKPLLKQVMINNALQTVEVQKIVKETRYKEKFVPHEIAKIEPHINHITRGKSKTRCEIFYKGDNQKYVIPLPIEKVEKIIDDFYNETKGDKIGFIYKNRI